jgi:hypothetical protein
MYFGQIKRFLENPDSDAGSSSFDYKFEGRARYLCD